MYVTRIAIALFDQSRSASLPGAVERNVFTKVNWDAASPKHIETVLETWKYAVNIIKIHQNTVLKHFGHLFEVH
jgi:hypothetical protein